MLVHGQQRLDMRDPQTTHDHTQACKAWALGILTICLRNYMS